MTETNDTSNGQEPTDVLRSESGAGNAETIPEVKEESGVQPPDEESNPLKEKVIEVMHTVFDPEIPVNVYELGLVYGIDIDSSGAVVVRMTLTSPACPVAGSLPPEVEAKVRGVEGVTSAKVDLVWDPPWNPSLMSEAAKLQLGMF